MRVKDVVASYRRSLTARERPKLEKKALVGGAAGQAYDDSGPRLPFMYDDVSASESAASRLQETPEREEDAAVLQRSAVRRYNPPATGSKESYTLLKARKKNPPEEFTPGRLLGFI